MQTNFAPEQLADPKVARSESILRSCVHCGFCTATCPTYVTLGNELDSPRGRIYLIKDMLENDRPADARTVKHIDRCLSCLSCMTTCPSGVHYMHLVDHAREHIHRTYERPFMDRLRRGLLSAVLPHPARFRASIRLAQLGRFAAPALDKVPALRPFAAMLRLAPRRVPKPSPVSKPSVHRAEGARRGRVAILTNCAQPVLDPGINEAAVRLLTRLGVEVVVARGEGCCGSLDHHMGNEAKAHGYAKRLIDAWLAEADGEGLDAIVITVSGCGTTIKDYAHMLRLDPDYADRARRVSALCVDITEYLGTLGLSVARSDAPGAGPGAPGARPDGARAEAKGIRVAYHSACSLRHGQKVTAQPKALLAAAGFTVLEPAESHLCCGSAGTYNILQPEIAGTLRDRKVANLERTAPDVIAAGNIGCLTQIGTGTRVPTVHTVQLLDWAHGGPRPAALGRVLDRARALEAAE